MAAGAKLAITAEAAIEGGPTLSVALSKMLRIWP